MSNRFIQVPGTREWVNPHYVTNVFAETHERGGDTTCLWVVGQSGYGTKKIETRTAIDQVLAVLDPGPNAGYVVIEDNGGGLHLFITAGEEVVWGGWGYEHLDPDDFLETLALIQHPDFNPTDPVDWDSEHENLAIYHEMLSDDVNYKVIAKYKDMRHYLYTRNMGVAGRRAFGFSGGHDER